eukprot:scaffold9898_cov198-Skeletonema_marinoi.AAC.7
MNSPGPPRTNTTRNGSEEDGVVEIAVPANRARENGHEHQNRGECDDDVIVTVKRAGKKEVNGTYKKDCNRYTRSARYDGKDVEYSIEKRVVNGKKMWVLCCRSEEGKEDPVDFYRATVNETCEYPSSVKWVSTLIGSGPAPRSEVSYFGG